MTITVLKAPLHRAMQIASPILGRSVLPILDNVKFSQGTMHATNAETHVLIREAVPVDFPEILIPSASLKEVLSNCKGPELNFTFGKNKIDIAWGKSKLSITLASSDTPDMFPDLPKIIGEDEQSIVPGFIVADAMKCLSPLVNAFSGVTIDNPHDSLLFDGTRFIASNIMSMFVMPLPEDALPLPRKQPLLIHSRALGIMRPGMDSDPVVIGSNSITWGDIVYFFPTVAKAPMDYNQFINLFSKHLPLDTVTMDTSDFMRAITVAEMATREEKAPYVSLFVNGSACLVRGASSDNSFSGETQLLIEEVHEEGFKIHLNMKSTPTISRAIGGEKMCIGRKNGFPHINVTWDDGRVIAYLGGFAKMDD